MDYQKGAFHYFSMFCKTFLVFCVIKQPSLSIPHSPRLGSRKKSASSDDHKCFLYPRLKIYKPSCFILVQLSGYFPAVRINISQVPLILLNGLYFYLGLSHFILISFCRLTQVFQKPLSINHKEISMYYIIKIHVDFLWLLIVPALGPFHCQLTSGHKKDKVKEKD